MIRVPTDDVALSLLDEALNASLDADENGEPVIVGAQFNMPRLLRFWSGDNVSREEPEFLGYGLGGLPVIYEPGSTLTRDDVIRALIDEVRRLRHG